MSLNCRTPRNERLETVAFDAAIFIVIFHFFSWSEKRFFDNSFVFLLIVQKTDFKSEPPVIALMSSNHHLTISTNFCYNVQDFFEKKNDSLRGKILICIDLNIDFSVASTLKSDNNNLKSDFTFRTQKNEKPEKQNNPVRSLFVWRFYCNLNTTLHHD